jgi:hypothetical protein
VFLSESGFRRIPRGFGQLEAIGAAVTDTVSSLTPYRGVVAMTSLGTEARFLCRGGLSGIQQRTMLAYAPESGHWFRDTLPHDCGAFGAWGDGFVHSAVTLIPTGPHFFYQDSDAPVTDHTGTFMAARFATSWQHPFGVGGFGRVNRLVMATEGQPVRLNLTVETDSGQTQTATLEYTANRTPYNYREMALAVPACGAYRVTGEEVVFSGYSANSEFGLTAFVAETDDSDAIRPADEGERV